MFQDVAQQTAKKIFNDKILLGLLIVCLLGIFVGGFNRKQTARSTQETTEQSFLASKEAVKPDGYSSDNSISPDLAVQFVKWWLKPAMDYTSTSAIQSHKAAANWMTDDVSKTFDEAFWNPVLAQQITSGQLVGAFQPMSVQAEAINPDKSVVVGLTGMLILAQSGGRPTSHQIQMDVLVRKSDTGLRIAGLYNRLTSLSTSIY